MIWNIDRAASFDGDGGQRQRTKMFDYLGRLIAQRRQHPGNDLVSALVTGTIDGAGLSQPELLWNALLLILGGLESLRIAIVGGMHALLENPAEFAKLRANPALMESAIEEMLRWTAPATHAMRTARRDCEIGGHQVLANQRIVMWFASANRDEDVFKDSEHFHIDRSPNSHLTFSHGNHFCIGSGLARLEMRVMFEEIVRRMTDIETGGTGRMAADQLQLRHQAHADSFWSSDQGIERHGSRPGR